ncbi:hypothetical protein FSST1_010519 [Fusarium sambucinum]
MARSDENSGSGRSSNRRDLRDDERRHEIERLQRDNAQTQSRLARLLNEDFIPHRGRSQARVHSRRDDRDHSRRDGRDNRDNRDNRSGRDGQPSRSSSTFSRASTQGKSGKNTYSGVSKNSNDRIGWVHKAEMREYTGTNGRMCQTVVNTSYGGGNQSRFAALTPTGAMGMTNRAVDLARVAEDVIGNGRDSLLSFQMSRIPRDLRAFKEASTTRVKVTPSFEPSEATRALQRPVDVVSTVPGIRCIGCDLSSHSLKDCLYAPNGYIEGCIFCNTHTHKTDACRQFGNMNLENKVKTLVHQRQWRPALKTAIMWWDYLMDYIQKGGNDMPEEFPWSDDFAIAKVEEDDAAALARVQEVWDENRNVQDLPKDPKHASREEVLNLYQRRRLYPTPASGLRQARDGQFPANTSPLPEEDPRRPYDDSICPAPDPRRPYDDLIRGTGLQHDPMDEEQPNPAPGQ